MTRYTKINRLVFVYFTMNFQQLFRKFVTVVAVTFSEAITTRLIDRRE